MGQVRIKWVEDRLMIGTDSNNHSIVIGRTHQDNHGIGVKPAELLLMAAASCSGYDVVEILEKQRQPLRGLEILCSGNQQKDAPYSFTEMHLHYILYGDLDAEKVERAIRLSQEKYCSVVATLRPSIPVTFDYEIRS
ncbi:MAG: OsmC family protein [Anaerolineales bacterium]|nr:OsmC family protein [Anaerolineales bacterium]MCS7248959.1 OsmC family protein [Anaerolineales bacterium]MDW8162772.1 OsmC family protein [Anaerolineales bacterium]MDW8446998.1 OsmC family protein [Anaerolineales bacterium]